MGINKQLLPLGKINPDDGLVYFDDSFSIRVFPGPDYSSFKEPVHNKEDACVDVLVGLSGCNYFYEMFENEMSERWTTHKNRYPEKSHIDRAFEFQENIQVKRFHDVEMLFNDIKEKIEIGIASGNIGDFVEREVPFEDEYLFRRDRYYDSFSFLNWMKRNGYPIPEELKFYKNESGEFEWVTPLETIMPPYKSKDLNEQLNEFLKHVKPDIDTFYEKFAHQLKVNEYKDKLKNSYQEYAKSAFIEAQPLTYLQEIDFMCFVPPTFNEELKVRIKGQIAKKMIERMDNRLLKIDNTHAGLRQRLNCI